MRCTAQCPEGRALIRNNTDQGDKNLDRRNELKQQYKLRKTEMGIFIIRANIKKMCIIQSTPDLKGVMNGAKFKLETGNYPNRELQKEWNELGEDNFVIEILERLDYDTEESKTDYSEDLKLLEMIWEDKLKKEGYGFYRR